MIHLEGLDPDQMQAVLAPLEPLVVMAAAGSGKTRVLTTRVAHQVLEHHVDPDAMFVTTFTKAASKEMDERLEQILGEFRPLVGTFHSIMFRLLNAEHRLNGRDTLGVLKESERTNLLKDLLGKPSRDYPEAINSAADIGIVGGRIGIWKNALIHANDPEVHETLLENPPSSELHAAARVYPLYEARLAALRKLDFDDMLLKTYDLLTADAQARARAQARWSSFSVDEAQDLNTAQWEILKLIAPPKERPNVTIVGDIRQALYDFRGAVPEQMGEFKDLYRATQLDLVLNYRSTPTIVKPANSMIASMKLPDQIAHRPDGEAEVVVAGFRDSTEQATELARMVTEMRDAGRKGGDIAVLIRTNAQFADIESAFVAAGLPYWCNNGGFFDRMEIGDMMAYLRLAHSRDDQPSLNRIINKPTRYLGRAFVDAVAQTARRETDGDLVAAIGSTYRYANKKLFPKQLESAQKLSDLLDQIATLPPYLAIDMVIKETNYMDWLRKNLGGSEGGDDSRQENLDALREIASRYSNIGQLIDFANQATKLQMENGDATEICTVHRSKGRQWPVVFVSNFFDGSFPHKMAIKDGKVAEELRVAYVAFTRAADQLVVGVPRIDPKGEVVFASRFIDNAGIEFSHDEEEPENDWLGRVMGSSKVFLEKA